MWSGLSDVVVSTVYLHDEAYRVFGVFQVFGRTPHEQRHAYNRFAHERGTVVGTPGVFFIVRLALSFAEYVY